MIDTGKWVTEAFRLLQAMTVVIITRRTVYSHPLPLSFSFFSFEAGSWTGLELTTAKGGLEILVLLLHLFKFWGYRRVLPPFGLCSAGNQTQSSMRTTQWYTVEPGLRSKHCIFQAWG